MSFTWFHPAVLSFGAMLWSVTLSPTSPPPTDVAPQTASLAGDLLIASPRIGDPRFWHAVILIVKQDDGGALGIVINRPVGTVARASLLQASGQKTEGIK